MVKYLGVIKTSGDLLKTLKHSVLRVYILRGKEAEKWLNKGFKELKEQVSEQILKDGGHFE